MNGFRDTVIAILCVALFFVGAMAVQSHIRIDELENETIILTALSNRNTNSIGVLFDNDNTHVGWFNDKQEDIDILYGNIHNLYDEVEWLNTDVGRLYRDLNYTFDIVEEVRVKQCIDEGKCVGLTNDPVGNPYSIGFMFCKQHVGLPTGYTTSTWSTNEDVINFLNCVHQVDSNYDN